MASHPTNTSSSLDKLNEVRRSSANQSARCKIMLQKLKAIQLQEFEEYGEQQFDAVIKTLAHQKQIPLKEAIVPDFLQKRKLPTPSPHAFERSDYLQQINPYPPPVDSKHGLADVEDVSQMMRGNIKEILLSIKPIKDDAETDSGSDFEDEIQTHISSNSPNQKLVYIPTKRNPSTEWAKKRLDSIRKFAWLRDSMKAVDQRLAQHDQLLQYIKQNKPAFKFDEAAKYTKPVIIGPNLEYATIKVYRESSDGSPSQSTADGQPNSNSQVYEKADNLVRTIGNFRKAEGAAGGGVVNRAGNGVGGGLESLKLRILDSPDPDATARRCIGLSKPFRRRKVLQIGGIHNVVGKSDRQPSMLCSCFGRTELCVVCSGRSDKIKRVRPGAMPKGETMALLDHNYHAVLSTSEEKPLRLIAEATLKNARANKQKNLLKRQESETEYSNNAGRRLWENQKWLGTAALRPPMVITEPPMEPLVGSVTHPTSYIHKPTVKTDKKTKKRKRLSDEEDEDDEEQVMNWTPKKSTSSDLMKKRRMADDIDDIVIPYSIAAATRVEKIEYKEIDIPSWRMNSIPTLKQPPLSTVARRNTRTSRNLVAEVEPKSEPEDVEDISLDTVTARHMRSEQEEKKRFLKAMNVLSNRRTRRSETAPENFDFSQPISPVKMDTSENILANENVASPTANQISASDASLAVTALKMSFDITNAVPSNSRQRSVSSCQIEEDDAEEPGVSPFEPRRFPLSDEEYNNMLKEMKESYQEDLGERHDSGSSILFGSRQSRANDSDEDNSEIDDPDWGQLTEMSSVFP